MRQKMIVDNHAGGGGIVAAQIAVASPADGYTVLLASASSVSIAPFLAKKRPYDSVQDFTPVTLVAIAPPIVTMHPSLPVKSVKELIGLAKARPDQLLFASPSAGSVHHLTMEMFSRAAGITMVHVPYKGGPPAVIDTVSGRVQLVITTVPPVLSHVRASRLRALAVTSSKRMSV
ncbi:MAG: tripartite tricarboxylate transporter substrate binding protein, partial [Betaproteobacteria bacterium]|nr:tripartite tricarboxylate transporter substrate binding protein [Betaproteobacteria bacterium]